ncbi:MAG TPA: flagellar hook-basal body protein [Caulobacteraceae bacterium]|jgi:flagellar basal-body rod protein FlgG|nr:flagellar hook-basal body protein [Caulobacteraceae bacterium]
MNGAFYIGATGLDAQERALDVVSNNIANMNTNGFKRSQVQFLAMLGGAAPVRTEHGHGRSGRLAALMGSSGANTWGVSQDASASTSELLGVKLAPSQIDFAQGTLTQTGRPLDVAIDGDGFFELAGPGGQTLLWRGGTLTVNADGYLAASNGLPLKSMISVPTGATSLSIGADGKVQAVLAGATTTTVIGQIDLAMAKDPSTLTAMTGGLYSTEASDDLTNAAPGAEGLGLLVPGSVEASNVDLASEMVNLLLMQRAYSANAQVVQAGDQLMSIANDLKR